MYFVYNENACNLIIEFCEKRLETIEKELEFLSRERGLAMEPAVRHAMDEALSRCRYDKECVELKKSEMEACIASASSP